MKRLICAIMSLILLISGYIPVSAKDSSARSIVIFATEGDVRMTKGTVKEFKAKEGAKLSDGFTVSTGEKSYCYIKLDEDSLTKMDEASKIQVSKTSSKKLSISVLSGAMCVDAAPQGEGEKIEIRAGSTALAIRGTLFIVEYMSDGIYTIYMLQGSGEVDGVIIEAGYILRSGINDSNNYESGQYVMEKIEINESLSLFMLEAILENIEELIDEGIFSEDDIAKALTLAEEKRTELNDSADENEATYYINATPTPTTGSTVVPTPTTSESTAEPTPTTRTPEPTGEPPMPRSYNVTYNMNRVGVSAPEPQSARVGDMFIVASPQVIRPTEWPPVEFKEWNTRANGTGTTYMPGNRARMPEGGLILYAIWEALPLYNVSYDLNGGTGTIPTENPKVAEESFLLADISGIAPPADKVFKEWNTAHEGNGISLLPGEMFSMPSHDVTFYAIWESLPINYTVTYDLCSGSGIIPTEYPHAEGGTFVAAGIDGITSPPGYEFKEWNTMPDGSGTGYAIGDIVTMPNHDLTLYAIWNNILVYYTVTYDLCSGSGIAPAEETHAEGEKFSAAGIDGVTPPPGTQFKEWNTMGDGSGSGYNIGESITMPAYDFILYAVWENVNIYNLVTYDINGGTGIVPTETAHIEGEVFAAAGISGITPPYRTQFKEWNTMVDGSGRSYVIGESVTMPAYDLILYAIWEDIPIYTVIYNLNGGTGEAPPELQLAEYDTFSVADIPGVDPPVGKRFKEWNTQSDETGTVYAIGATVTMLAYDLILYAIWEDIPTYTVTYELNGGTGEAPPELQLAEYDTFSVADIPGVDPPVGKRFKEWNTQSDGTGTVYAISESITMPAYDLILYAIWEDIPTYTVTYDLNGGTGEAPPVLQLAEYDTFSVADIPGVDPPVGKRFKEWNTQPDGTSTVYAINESVAMPAYDLILYAIWEDIPTYMVIYNLNGGTGEAPPELQLAEYDTFFAADIPGVDPPVGKRFKEWNTQPDGTGTVYAIGESVTMPAYDLILYATWEDIPTYAVTYELNGGIGEAPPELQLAEYDTFYVADIPGVDPPVGKRFKEWNTQPDGTGTVYAIGESVTMPAYDLILYAIWEDIPTYTVIYNLNGGTGEAPLELQLAEYDTFSVADILGVYPPVGKRFKEWNTQSDGTGAIYAIGASVTMPAYDLILYAIWEDIPTYTVIYNLNGGTGEAPLELQLAEYDTFSVADISGVDPPVGKRFKEWNTQPDGTGTVYAISESVTMPAYDLILYAIWEDIPTYTVIYNLNGGTGEAPLELQLAEHDTFSVADIPGVDPPVGKRFKEWTTQSDGTGAIYAIGATVTMPAYDLILYAIWEDIPTYTVTYDLNGGTGEAPAVLQLAEYDTFSVADIPGVDPPVGKRFKEWNTQFDGTGAVYAISESVTMPAYDLILYAIWEDTPTYTVTYDLNGGTSEAPLLLEYPVIDTLYAMGISGIIPPAEMQFKEWNTLPDGTGTGYAIGAIVTMPAYNLTLYAIWTFFIDTPLREIDIKKQVRLHEEEDWSYFMSIPAENGLNNYRITVTNSDEVENNAKKGDVIDSAMIGLHNVDVESASKIMEIGADGSVPIEFTASEFATIPYSATIDADYYEVDLDDSEWEDGTEVGFLETSLIKLTVEKFVKLNEEDDWADKVVFEDSTGGEAYYRVVISNEIPDEIAGRDITVDLTDSMVDEIGVENITEITIDGEEAAYFPTEVLVPANGSVEIVYKANIPANSGDKYSIVNTATIEPQGEDYDLEDSVWTDEAEVEIPGASLGKLTVEKFVKLNEEDAWADRVTFEDRMGGEAYYRVVISNEIPDGLPGRDITVLFTDEMAEGATDVTLDGNSVSIPFECVVPANDSVEILYKVDIPENTGDVDEIINVAIIEVVEDGKIDEETSELEDEATVVVPKSVLSAEIEKSVVIDPASEDDPYTFDNNDGGTAHYTVVIRNTGEAEITVDFYDEMAPVDLWGEYTIPVGESISITYDVEITPNETSEDVHVPNAARIIYVNEDGEEEEEEDEVTIIVPKPILSAEIEKSVVIEPASEDDPLTFANSSGGTAYYTVVIRNTGEAEITVDFYDEMAPVVLWGEYPIPVGESISIPYTLEIPTNDSYDEVSHMNTAIAEYTDNDGKTITDESEVVVVVPPLIRDIEIVKKVSLTEETDWHDYLSLAHEGGRVNYKITVTNSGEVAESIMITDIADGVPVDLSEATVTPDTTPFVSNADGNIILDIAAGESATLTYTMDIPANESSEDMMVYRNIVEAAITVSSEYAVVAEDSAEVDVEPISGHETKDWSDYITLSNEGGLVDYKITLTNSGEMTEIVTITDIANGVMTDLSLAVINPVSAVFEANTDGSIILELAAGESVTITYFMEIPASESTEPVIYVNTATATFTGNNSEEIIEVDDATVEIN